MPRPPVKKVEQSKMSLPEHRRPPVYRPKSRTDSSTSGSRMEGGRLRGDGGASSDDDSLSRQNVDLRQRLQEEASAYRRRLDTYRQAQQNQAALVSRLQAKVLQYKQRCTELETQLTETAEQPLTRVSHHMSLPPSSALEQAQQHLREVRSEKISDLDTALLRLEEERQKNDKLTQINNLLREQLEESHTTNEAITGDLQKLTNDFEALREEMLIKEDEWKDEEQAFNDYYSAEHNRLLNLWKDVVSMKRLFIDVQTITDRDLSKLKSEISDFTRDVVTACSRIDRKSTGVESIFEIKEKQHEQEANEIRSRYEQLKAQLNSLQNELRMKDERIEHLTREIQNLEERCSEAEQNVSQLMQLQDETEVLQAALKDIAYALIQDAEAKDLDLGQATHIHLSTSTPLSQKSPRKATLHPTTSPTALAESTISAVQAALHKYQSVIHELQVKLQSNKEQLLLVRKQYENSEENNNSLEQKVKELVAQLDASRTHSSTLAQERDLLQKSLDSTRSEKNHTDRNRLEITSLYESLNSDYEKLQKLNSTLQKEVDSLQEEKVFLQGEIDRLNQEAEIREINLRGEEDRCSRIREELLSVREELNKLYLAHDMLEQQKIEADNIIGNLERAKADCEQKLEQVLGERSNVSDSLAKKENIAASLQSEKQKLQEDLQKLEDEKIALQLQCTDQQNDMQSLRKELLQAEQNRLDLDADKQTLTEKVRFLEIEKEKLEMELTQIARERGDLSNQLTALARKKESLNEELMRVRQKLEQSNETNARINRNLEDLVKECEEKQCVIDNLDKELQRTHEQIAGIRSEKEAMEAILFDTQTNLENCEAKRNQLEKDQQDSMLKQESQKNHINKLTKDLERSEKRCQEIKSSFSQQSGVQEVEFQQTLKRLKEESEDNFRKLTEEKEAVRSSLEKRLQQSLLQLTNEKDSEIRQLLERVDALQHHIDNLCQQHEELMLRAENDKQQALLIAHHDQQALLDRLEATKRELEAEKETFERFKREANGKFEQDRGSLNVLKEELNKHKTRLEENRVKMEDEIRKLEQKMDEVKSERDSAQQEMENVKIQLHLAEDKSDNLNNQLHETLRKLKEVENNGDSLRKELTDVRRQLADSNFEKEKYHTSNKELRDYIKRVESEKREIMRQLEETFQKITVLEEVKLSLENERIQLLANLKESEKDQHQIEDKVKSLQEELQKSQSMGSKQQAEEKELQARLLNEVEERERAHQEAHQLKKQITELERNLEQIRQELGRTRTQGAQLEEQWHAREQDLLVHLEDSRVREKRLEDQKHNLEICLVDATQQIQELKAKLGGAEGRIRALDTQLMQLEGAKKEVEQKLGSVVATLRRIAGVQLDGTVTLPYKLMSPSRRWSPARSHDDGKDIISDIDPEVVRKGVRNLMQQVAQIERERDDLKTQVASVKKQLTDVQESQSKGDSKLNKVLQNLRNLQEEKGSLEAKLGQKSVALQAQTEALQKKSQETQEMRDKIVTLELSINTCTEEKQQFQNKIEKLKAALSRLETEKRTLQEELNRTENRATKLELQRMSAEGDLQRLQMILQEKDGAIQKLQEKCDAQARTVASLEERCVSLKSTVDQLNLGLERAAAGESELRGEMQGVQRQLVDAVAGSHSGAEKLKQLQKALSNTENERRVLSERLDSCQQSLAEFRRNNQILQDQVSRLNNDLANNEVQKSALESQLRLSQWPSDGAAIGATHHEEDLLRQLQSVQREKNELRGKVESLNSKVRQLQNEQRTLERTATTTTKPSIYKPYEKYERETFGSDYDPTRHEPEIRELRAKIAQLEAELAEKDTELNKLRAHRCNAYDLKFDRTEIERYRAAQLQAERLLEAREQSHRQQVARLEQQLSMLREQLNQEIKRRQQYVLRSTKAGREMAQLRQALGDSLRTVSQDPGVDALLLEHEARKLDDNIAASAGSLPTLSFRRQATPQPPKEY